MVCSESLYAQNVKKRTSFRGANASAKKTFYIGMNDLSETTYKALDNEGIKYAYIFYKIDFDRNNSGNVDSTQLVRSINSKIPNNITNGIAVIDWEETEWLKITNPNTPSDSLNAAIDKYLRALRIAKECRPNLSWGIYGLPLRRYWYRDDLEKDNNRILRLLKAQDVYYLDIYDFYENNWKGDSAYVADNVRYALKLGYQYKKPVIPFVWHRYHTSNKKVGLEKIPEKYFLDYIRVAATTSYKQSTIKGLIWWSAEKYFFMQNPKLMKEIDDGQTVESHINNSVLNLAPKINQKIRPY
ncbi:hypothetical protein C3K47_01810 [Solitalea longa]|uniref:Hyaluronidase n=2 Tax=Solitalea longa TaxID=2079460 RepID=A0A2S5A9M4_9SPHI|nr:hypothetical protein C3K47_01810 [Solitalea longa]